MALDGRLVMRFSIIVLPDAEIISDEAPVSCPKRHLIEDANCERGPLTGMLEVQNQR